MSKRNCDVSISHNLHDGLDLVEDKHPDVVILDNNLPDGLGWAEANKILKIVPSTHLFLISANKPNATRALENQTFDVIEKPISISQIENFLK